jgi:hypothetical protein
VLPVYVLGDTLTRHLYTCTYVTGAGYVCLSSVPPDTNSGRRCGFCPQSQVSLGLSTSVCGHGQYVRSRTLHVCGMLWICSLLIFLAQAGGRPSRYAFPIPWVSGGPRNASTPHALQDMCRNDIYGPSNIALYIAQLLGMCS